MKKQHVIIDRLDALHTKLLKTMADLQAKGIRTEDTLPIAAVADELEHLIKPAIQWQTEQAQPKMVTVNIGSLYKSMKIKSKQLDTDADVIMQKISKALVDAVNNAAIKLEDTPYNAKAKTVEGILHKKQRDFMKDWFTNQNEVEGYFSKL